MGIKKLLTILIACGLITSCATPSQHFHTVASQQGFVEQQIDGQGFQHKIYRSKNITSSKTLHVYLDGDGTPWERNRWIAKDPTARNPLILALMAQDTTPSILLGRPCYYGLSHSGKCHSKYWTSHRYSKEVVDSMADALKAWLSDYNFDDIVLIGYSGGGSLAMLMAEKIHGVKKVVTVAANLDVAAWSQYHGYQPLINSLNPATQESINKNIMQLHIAGEQDSVVPSFIIKDYAKNQQNSRYVKLPNNDHTCCWKESWVKILGMI